MMNPATIMKIMNAKNKFTANHPKFVAFLNAVFSREMEEGTVIEISVFYTKLRTIDNKIIVIPNGTLANTSLTNATKSDRRQMDLVVPIGYDADIKKAKDILMELVEAENRRLPEDVNVFVKELGASSVDLGLRFWVPTDQYWPVRWQLLEDIKIRFDAEKISIPFQQVDVNIKQ